MKNLVLHRLVACDVLELKSATHFCISSSPDKYLIYFYKDGILYSVCTKNNKVIKQYTLEHLYPTECPTLVGMAYLCVADSVCLVFQNGDIVGLENEKFEYIGDIPSGVRAMEWSPDEELVALLSGDGNVILMTSTFDPIIEVAIHQENFGEKEFITVGWGKKETQFHGSAGKAAARAPVQSEPTAAFAWDDHKPRVSWRGDGNLFAVSAINPQNGARQLRVFNREGSLQYTSEPCPGLEQALHWKPSGSVIASTQRLPNKHLVAFFEKNGLRHGEITLPFAANDVKVRELGWNAESSILAVWCEGLTEGSELCSLQLWASTNYHWHLKQTLNFPPDQRMISFAWDKDKPTCLHVLQEGPRYLEYQWRWSVERSCGMTADDAVSVAVVDGAQVKMTNFRDAVIPPPMCAYALKLPSSVNCVAFSSSAASNESSPNDVCVILGDNSIAIFSETSDASEEWAQKLTLEVPEDGLGFADTTRRLVPRVLCPLQLGNQEIDISAPLVLHHWLWLAPRLLLCVAPVPGFTSVLLAVRLEANKAYVTHSVAVPEPVLGLSALPGSVDVAVFTESKHWRWTNPEQGGTLQALQADAVNLDTAPARCQQYAVLDVASKTTVVGLTSLGQLYVNRTLALKNCTSFLVLPEFLLLTTLQQQLFCVPRTKRAFELLSQRGECGAARQVERGATLVTAAAWRARVVLQMPRGNLEAIEPRALALHIVQSLLDQGKFAEAFDLMRRQRINLNIFYDHDPNFFLSNVKEFVLQVKNPSWLCLFVSELMEADVTRGMYASHYSERAAPAPAPSTAPKLDLICHNMRQVLEETDSEGLVLPVITTFIKQSSPDVGAALQRVREIKRLEQEGRRPAASSDEALGYLLYIVDVYELFDVALGLYDFDLVMLVAAKSQKDPKEYIPFLNELRKLETNYQKFSIDKHLKKYESALEHLSRCDESRREECMNFIKSHKLYRAALKIFSLEHPLYLRVCQSYAETLVSDGNPEEAGILFSRSGLHFQAFDAFIKAGAWRRALAIVPQLKLSGGDLASRYRIVAHELRERKQFEAAAAVFGEYLQDTEERVVCLCMARAWDEAIRVASAHNLPALTESVVRSGVVEHGDSVAAQLGSWRDQLPQQVARLAVVREEKARRLEEEGEELPATADCDMFSDTSSIMGSTKSRSSAASRSSSKTYRSSKNKRKHERKLLSLKEGSPYEDLALIRALHDLYSRAYQLREEVRALNLSLLHFGMDSRAIALQAGLSSLLLDMEAKQAAIWLPELAHTRALALKAQDPGSASDVEISPALTTAAAELEPHLCLPPTRTSVAWKLAWLS